MSRKKPITAPAAKTPTGRLLILVESMQGQIQGVAESVLGIDRRLARLEDLHLDMRLSSLEAAVRENSASIRNMEAAMVRVEEKLDTKADKRDEEALAARVTALEPG